MESVWNENFLDENELSYESSDSDINSGTIGHDSSSELEVEFTQVGPAILVTHNQTRCDRLQGDIADKVCHVLHVIEDLGLNLTLFLENWCPIEKCNVLRQQS